MNNTAITVIALAGFFFNANTFADDYDYEIGLSIGRSDFDSTRMELNDPFFVQGSSTSSDSDTINLSGTWYYSGLSDAYGPKSRSAFFSRASTISLDYSYSDNSSFGRFMGGGIFNPSEVSTDGSTTSISAKIRHVWRDSGWYALGGIERVESESDGVSNNISFFTDFEETAYTLGAGKYIGQATSVDLSIIEADVGPSSFAISLNHIGSIGKDWQYGTDLRLAKANDGFDDGSYALRGSLYPSPNFEFGMAWSRQQFNDGFDRDTLEGFTSWFVRDHVELTARYQSGNPDTLAGEDIDDTQFGIGVNVRF